MKKLGERKLTLQMRKKLRGKSRGNEIIIKNGKIHCSNQELAL